MLTRCKNAPNFFRPGLCPGPRQKGSHDHIAGWDWIPHSVSTYHCSQLKQTCVLCFVLPQRGGFFVECGALDGERSSNTIWLERERGWTGLLVEMDPYFYTQLIGKSRQSWSINACLSPQPYVTHVSCSNSMLHHHHHHRHPYSPLQLPFRLLSNTLRHIFLTLHTFTDFHRAYFVPFYFRFSY